MGRILRIELENFKSYRGTQTIGPFVPFTAIIGPNGSGKSNIMDSICFVLGIRASHLRGSHLKDLVYRVEGEAPASRRARVSLVYADDTDNETTFTRTVHTSGSSDYRINDRVVNFEEYDDQLKAFGILTKARNFLVFQGDVENIASKSARELAQLFEIISHSDELITEYDALLKEKERTEEDTIFNFNRKRGMMSERNQYKEQTAEAQRFQELLNRRAELQLDHILWQLYHIEQTISSESAAIEAEKKELERLAQRHGTVSDQLKGKRKEQATHHRTVMNLEKKIQEQEKALARKRPQFIKLKEQVVHLKKRTEKTEKTRNEAAGDVQRQISDIEALKKELDKLQEAKSEFEAEAVKKKKENPSLDLDEAQVAEYNTIKDEAGRATAADRQLLSAAKREQNQAEDSMKGLLNTEAELNQRKLQLEEQRVLLEERRRKVEAFVNSYTQKHTEVQEELKQLHETRAKNKEKREETSGELDRVQDILRQAKADKREAERDARKQELLSSLKRLYPGVRGQVLDLCKPTQRKYNVAVTVALGRNMDAIVVDTEKTARECIQYLKEQRVGHSTFIPLDSIKTKPLNEEHRQLGGTAKLILDILDFDSSIQRAMLYACGNTIVVDSIEEARRLAFGGGRGGAGSAKVKVVTLDGTQISKSGMMTGGLAGVEERAAAWDAKALNAIKKQRDKLLKDLSGLGHDHKSESASQALAAQVTGLVNRIKYSNADLQVTETRLKENKTEMSQLVSELAKLQPQINKLKKTLKEKEEAVEELQRKINRVEDRVFAEFSSSVGIKSIREYEETRLKDAEEEAARRVAFANQIAKLTSQIEYEEKRDLTARLKTLEEKSEKEKVELSTAVESEKAMSKENEKIRSVLDGLKQDLRKAKAEVASREVEVKEIRGATNSVSSEVASHSKTITVNETHIERLRQKRHALYQRCRVQEVDIPLLRGSISLADALDGSAAAENESTSAASSRSQSQSQSVQVRMATVREDSIKVDYTRVPTALRAKEDQSVDSKFQDDIADVTSSIQRMAPNLKAGDRLDDVSSRLKGVTEEFDVARKAAKQAAERFNVKKAERSERFMKAFDHCSKVIDSVYKDLTRSEENPMGGTAYLSLENADEPFSGGVKFNAMPPMKRFRDMDQLSGGERTVAALALLFAIHSFRPAPFFVLDEIDAALDSLNVQRVARFIKERSADTQFLVISLKDTFFEKADALFGVFKQKDGDYSSCVSIDLREYAE